MLIKELFAKDINRPINGAVKVAQDNVESIRQELDEYVVTDELERHFRSFFDSYKTPHSDPSIANRVGVWISGFLARVNRTS